MSLWRRERLQRWGPNRWRRTWAVQVALDSSTAKSIASRSGVGKVRHLDTKALWVQEAVRTGRLSLHKVRGDANPANLLTKPLSHDDMLSELDILKAKVVKSVNI